MSCCCYNKGLIYLWPLKAVDISLPHEAQLIVSVKPPVMVNANNIAACMVVVWVPVCGRNDQVSPPWRSLFGRKINKADQIRVQAARINRLEQRIQKLSDEGAFLTARGQQHREMRVKGNRELREKIEELNLKLLNQHEDMHKDFEHKLVAVREEMWSQAERDRAALENELGLRHEADRERIMEEANQRANEIIEVAKAKMATEAERDRELYAQRAALAEEGQELAREDRKQLQMEKEELERKLQETIDMEDRFRRKIILKFKARENTLRQNFEAQLREARAEAASGAAKRSKPVTPDVPSASSGSSAMEGSQRVAMKPSTTISSGGGSGAPSSTGAAATPQR